LFEADSTGWFSRAETRFIEEEEAGGPTAKCRQRNWLGVSTREPSTG
jgi:hypothetical protein